MGGKPMHLIISILLLLLLAGPVGAETFYVRTDAAIGTYGAEDGTTYADAWNGWANVDWGVAVGIVGPADTLYVCGNHGVTTTPSIGASGTAGNTIYIRGDSPSEAGTLTLSDGAYFNLARNYIEFHNITFNQTDPTKNCVYFGNSDSIVFSGVTFTGGKNGISFAHVNNNTPDNIKITGCDFSGQAYGGVYYLGTDSSGVSLTNLQIVDNVFANGGNNPIEIRSEDDAPNAGVTNLTVARNTMSNYTGWVRLEGNGVTTTSSWRNLRVQDNTLTNVAGGFGIASWGATEWGHNIISGNVVTGTTNAAGGVDLFFSQYVDIYDNTIGDGTTTTIDGNAILVDYGNTDVRIYNNTLYNMTGKDGVQNAGCGIMILDSTHVTSWNNAGWGNKVGLWVGDTGTVANPAPSGITAYNNTFALSLVSGFVIRSNIEDPVNIYATNNIFTGAGTGSGVENLSGATVGYTWDYNLVYGFTNNYVGVTDGGHDVNADPLFVSSGSSNFRLTKSSPAIDVGTLDRDGDGVNETWRDLDGYTVPHRAGLADIGAYEYGWTAKDVPIGGAAYKTLSLGGSTLDMPLGRR